MKLALSAALLALAATSAASQGTAPRTAVHEAVTESIPAEEAAQADEIRFRTDSYRRMTVPVRLSGKGPYRFLVDTGSDRTAISRELAASLNLPVESTARLHSVTGISEVETATVPHLQFSRKERTNVEAPLLSAANIGADGILGLDSLHSQRILFDFKARTMAIVPREQWIPRDEEGTIVVTGRLKNGRLILSRARADDQLISVVLDTGAQISIGNEALRRRLLKAGKLSGSGRVELLSITGEKISGDYAFLGELEFGGVKIRNLGIVFADAHTFRKLGLDDRPALLLGMNAMRAFDHVTIDFANKKLRLRLPDQSSLDQVMMAGRAARVEAAFMAGQ